MPVPPTALPVPRRAVGPFLLALVGLLAALAAVPQAIQPGLALPAAPRASLPPGHSDLVALVQRLSRQAAPPARPDRHALRLTVTAFAVRLAVAPEAAHPLDGPVAVRPTLLGSPGQALRLVSLDQPPQASQAPEPKPQAAAPAPLVLASIDVKNPSPAPTLAEATAAPPTASGRSVLVAGDSLSIFLAQALRPLLASRPGTAFAAKGKVSSGLARPDFFDWEREMDRLAATTRPDTAVVMIAANDNKTMTRPDGSKVVFGRPDWDVEYSRRVARLVAILRRHSPAARIYWVGAPVMADPGLNADVAKINVVIRRQLAAIPGCQFIDVSHTLADASGRYAKDLPTAHGSQTARTPDGVHLTPFGAKLLANACLASMSPAVAELSRP